MPRPNICSSRPFSALGQPLVFSALALLAGCAPIQIAMGTRLRLDKIQVKEISAQLQEGTSLWPGGSAPLVVTAHSEDGNAYVTEGASHGKVLWESYRFDSPSAAGVKVTGHGVVKLDGDPRSYVARPIHLRITSLSRPERSTELDVPVRFDVPFEASYFGSSGFPGTSGLNGSTGSSGSNGSMDPLHPSAGGDGGRGGDGGDGGTGSNGGSGPDVQVFVALQPGTPLLRIRVEANKSARYFLVDPKGGSLLIRSEGGRGGDGGKGGSGGAGGSGGMGWPSGSTGLSGNAGHDGWGGGGGKGGRITVWVDPAAWPYRDALHFSNRGGGGGGGLGGGSGSNGPAPEIRETAVTQVW